MILRERATSQRMIRQLTGVTRSSRGAHGRDTIDNYAELQVVREARHPIQPDNTAFIVDSLAAVRYHYNLN